MDIPMICLSSDEENSEDLLSTTNSIINNHLMTDNYIIEVKKREKRTSVKQNCSLR